MLGWMWAVQAKEVADNSPFKFIFQADCSSEIAYKTIKKCLGRLRAEFSDEKDVEIVDAISYDCSDETD